MFIFLKKEQFPILIVNVLALAIFVVVFLSRQNYEFLIYVGVIIFFLILILATNRKVVYPLSVLWGLTAWSILHMSGGGIFIQGKRLYEVILIPLVGAPYHIFKYDQFVHIVGFGVATILMYYLLKPSLISAKKRWVSLFIVVAMAGLGVGALNEIIEFIATVFAPQTGVGGYENTALDLVANLIGAIVAVAYLRRTEK